MSREATPFDTIESAHDYIHLLSVAVAEAKREVAADVKRERTGATRRRLEALRVAAYNLEKLECHLTKSTRILNDLRSLRRLLFQERGLRRPVVAVSRPGNGRVVTQAN